MGANVYWYLRASGLVRECNVLNPTNAPFLKYNFFPPGHHTPHHTNSYKSWTLSVQIAGTLVCESHWISILTLVSKYNFQNWLEFRSIDNIWDQFLADHKILEMSTLKFWNCYTHTAHLHKGRQLLLSQNLCRNIIARKIYEAGPSPRHSIHITEYGHVYLFVKRKPVIYRHNHRPSLHCSAPPGKVSNRGPDWCLCLTLGVIGSRTMCFRMADSQETTTQFVCSRFFYRMHCKFYWLLILETKKLS